MKGGLYMINRFRSILSQGLAGHQRNRLSWELPPTKGTNPAGRADNLRGVWQPSGGSWHNKRTRRRRWGGIIIGEIPLQTQSGMSQIARKITLCLGQRRKTPSSFMLNLLQVRAGVHWLLCFKYRREIQNTLAGGFPQTEELVIWTLQSAAIIAGKAVDVPGNGFKLLIVGRWDQDAGGPLCRNREVELLLDARPTMARCCEVERWLPSRGHYSINKLACTFEHILVVMWCIAMLGVSLVQLGFDSILVWLM